MDDDTLLKGLDLIDEAIGETEKELGILHVCIENGSGRRAGGWKSRAPVGRPGPRSVQESIRDMKRVCFGIIGCGLMGREFASAAARWAHLADMDSAPEIVAVCDANADLLSWYTGTFPLDRASHAGLPGPVGQPGGRGRLLCRAPPFAPRDLLRGHRGRQTPDGRKALRHRPAGQRRHPGRAAPSIRQVFVRCARSSPSFRPCNASGGMIEAGRLRADHRGQRRLPARQRPRSAETAQLETPWSSSTASTAAWATWACTSATCRSAPVGFRGRCAPCSRTSSPSAPTAAAGPRPAIRGTTPRCCAMRPTPARASRFP